MPCVQGGIKCPAGHLLSQVDCREQYVCDISGLVREGTGLVWRCSAEKSQGQGGSCDYDVCLDCVKRYANSSPLVVYQPQWLTMEHPR